ncbi:chromosome condensation and segregation SMC protein [Streptococcus pneumoniae]|nr:chromosome condensation and segregation SMC protein [Streptococcus pneumoniae]
MLAFSDDPDQMIELLRERFVALLQEEADVSNQLTRIENELENSRQLSQKQADQLEKLKEQLATAKEKAGQQKAELETAKEQVHNISSWKMKSRQPRRLIYSNETDLVVQPSFL